MEAIGAVVVLLLISIVTWIALYPAMWIDPAGTLLELQGGIALGASPHEGGNFFLGHPVGDPGPFFYPVAILLRITPWVMLGTLIAIIFAFNKNLQDGHVNVLLWLGIYIIVFLSILTLAPGLLQSLARRARDAP